MAFMGSTAVGGPLVGVVGELLGARASLAVGAVGCAAAVVLGLAYGRQQAPAPHAAHASGMSV
jgi:hypothetical protein